MLIIFACSIQEQETSFEIIPPPWGFSAYNDYNLKHIRKGTQGTFLYRDIFLILNIHPLLATFNLMSVFTQNIRMITILDL